MNCHISRSSDVKFVLRHSGDVSASAWRSVEWIRAFTSVCEAQLRILHA